MPRPAISVWEELAAELRSDARALRAEQVRVRTATERLCTLRQGGAVGYVAGVKRTGDVLCDSGLRDTIFRLAEAEAAREFPGIPLSAAVASVEDTAGCWRMYVEVRCAAE